LPLILAKVASRHAACRQRLRFLLFEFTEAFQGCRAPWYLRGLIGEPLREIGVILLHDVEQGFPGEIAMVIRK